jgi:hypothetical protein
MEQDIKINVIDSIMGSGKTSYVINKMNTDTNPKYIYVTPTLSEVARVKEACPKLDFKEPESEEHGTKYYNFKILVRNGENIVTTHALFTLLTTEILDDLKAQGYTLVIDEALTTVSMYDKLSQSDLDYLLRVEAVICDPITYRLSWNNAIDIHAKYRGRFDLVKRLCDNGNLIHFRETTLLWEFPITFLKVFKEVWALTYLFRGSTMHSYLHAENIGIQMYSLEGNPQQPNLVPYSESNEAEIKAKLRSLITIYEGKVNDIGVKQGNGNPLCKAWFRKADDTLLDTLKKGISNFFKNISDSESEDRAWTTFKDYRMRLSDKGYAKGFIANNTKATNQFMNRSAVAYVQNTFYHPIISGYFISRGVKTYEELFALCEMIQFIWRFQIRQMKPIHVFIPSQRMRELFKLWLESESVAELFEGINTRFRKGGKKGLALLDLAVA